MFDTFTQGIAAFNQVGLFIGALVCLGLGGLLLGSSLYRRLHGLRVTGTVIGVIDNGRTYTPVYRYTLPDGTTHEARSDTGSSAMRGKETGRTVPLMIAAHNPGDAQAANSYVSEVIGIVLIVPGLVLAWVALTAYPVTWMTWLMAAVMLVYLTERGHRVFVPKGARPPLAQWRAARGLDGPIDPATITPIERIIATPDGQQKLQAQARNARLAVPVLGLFALALLAIGIFQARTIARLEANGLRAPGVVVRLHREWSSGSDSHSTYYPVVRFQTAQNLTVEFKDSVGTNPPSHRVGDKVTVLYGPDDPRRDAVIDRGLMNWAIPGLLLLVAVLLGWLMVWMRRSSPTSDAIGGLGVPAPR
jgi:hypothetical protein